MSAPMILALLAGRKSQTRRALKQQPLDILPMPKEKAGREWAILEQREPEPKGKVIRCRFGLPGDLLWVREAWRVGKPLDNKRPRDILEPLLARGKGVTVLYEAGGWRSVGPIGRVEPVYPDNEPMPNWAGRYRHARFMPRWASRLTLRLTDVRVERLQDISEPDAIAEGIEHNPRLDPVGPCKWRLYGKPNTGVNLPESSYQSLWESINGVDSWAANPWVWALTFSVIHQNVGAVLSEAA